MPIKPTNDLADNIEILLGVASPDGDAYPRLLRCRELLQERVMLSPREIGFIEGLFLKVAGEIECSQQDKRGTCLFGLRCPRDDLRTCPKFRRV